MTKAQSFTLALRFALREMRSGLKGFYIFIACIALGVTAIGGVNGVSTMINGELSKQGQMLLAGDIRFSITQRPANTQELAFLEKQGKVATSIWMRSMAKRQDNGDQTMVEIKAIDKHYPLYGTLETKPAYDPSLLNEKNGLPGAFVSQLLLDRLQLKVGDPIMIGTLPLQIRGVIINEPDLLSEGFQLGPRIFFAKKLMAQTGLLQPGSLFAYVYKIAIPRLDNRGLSALKEKAEKDFPEARWNGRTRLDATPSLTKNIERFSQFLTLVGLTSLIVGGVGVANAVRAHLERKKSVIAIFKSLGASGDFVVQIYLAQILIMASIATLIGLVLAALMPFSTAVILGRYLPIVGHASIYPMALIWGLIFAILTTLAFALVPLGRAQNIPVTTLLRNDFEPRNNQTPRRYKLAALLFLAATAGFAVLTAYDKRMALIFLSSVACVFIILRIVATCIQYGAQCIGKIHSTALRLAIGNIYRKGNLTSAIVLALGLGLTLLMALATIDGNLRSQLADSVPQKAPNFFFTDIARHDGNRFKAFLQDKYPDSSINIVPSLRARITKLNGIDATKAKIHPDGEWVLRGDRNVTYAQELPTGSIIAEGQWWTENTNQPQVSFSRQEAQELGLKIGDTITVNILGHEITATITSLRNVDWDNFNMNFVMIFSPDALQGAPHVWIATFKTGHKTQLDDATFMREIGKLFPSVTVISVRDIITSAREIVDQIGVAIRASASIALIASILVLAGALAAGNQGRTHDAVVLKTLGATRWTLIRAFIYEYAILGIITALFAFLAGSAAGWSIARYKMDLTHATILPITGVTMLIIALILSVGLSLIGTWRILSTKPADYLKEL